MSNAIPGKARAQAAALAVAVTAVTAACGPVYAGSHGAGSSARSPGSAAATSVRCTSRTTRNHMLTLSKADNGKTVCVTKGTTVGIYLQGTPARKWQPIRASSPALKPVANGHLTLMIGVTAAFFQAVRTGVVTVSSSLPSCPGRSGASAPPASPAPGQPCTIGPVYHVTLVVRA